MKEELVRIPVALSTITQMKRNRDIINPRWSMQEYLTHITAMHTKVLNMKEDHGNN